MLPQDSKILEFTQSQKSDKAPFITYADLECINGKIDGCKNNFENLSTTKLRKHLPSGFSVSAISLFISMENKDNVYPTPHATSQRRLILVSFRLGRRGPH